MEVSGKHISLSLALPESFLAEKAGIEARVEKLMLQIQESMDRPGLSGVSVCFLDPRDGRCMPPDAYLPADSHESYQTLPDTAGTTAGRGVEKEFPLPSNDTPAGSLSGKDVYLNPGHGWTWRDSDYWGLQRSFVENNIEDFSNIDLVNQWLAAYCRNAGADVFSVRELDPQTNMVIVDNDDLAQLERPLLRHCRIEGLFQVVPALAEQFRQRLHK